MLVKDGSQDCIFDYLKEIIVLGKIEIITFWIFLNPLLTYVLIGNIILVVTCIYLCSVYFVLTKCVSP